MNKNEAIAILKKHEAELRRRGVRHAALFGSVVRGDTRPDSDIDILIELDEDNVPDAFAYAGVISYIRDLFPSPVDVANRASLRPHIRPSAERDALDAF